MNWQEIIVFSIVLLAGVAAIRTFLQQFSAGRMGNPAGPACAKCAGCTLVQPGRSQLMSLRRPVLAMMVEHAHQQAGQTN